MSIKQKRENFKEYIKRNEPSAPDDAVKSCLQRTSGISLMYVIYRWAQFLLHFMIALGSFIDYNRTWPESNDAPRALKDYGLKFYGKWFLYFTHWGCFMNMMQSLVGALVLSKAYKNRTSPGGELTIYGVDRGTAELYCRMYNLALLCSVYISSGFWMLIYNPEIFTPDLVLTSEHGVGTGFMLVDLFVVKMAYRMRTGMDALAVIIPYILFTLVHHLTGSLDRYQANPYIYELQDWSKPLPTLLQDLGSVTTLLAIHLAIWGLYQVRRRYVGRNHDRTS